MRARLLIAMGAALVLPSITALAASMGDYEGLFPELACQDGWAACLDGRHVQDATPVSDAAGRPLPSDMRIGWFDLEPTAAFSPFVGLSNYTGLEEAPAVAEAEEPAPPPRAPAANNDDEPIRDRRDGSASGVGSAPSSGNSSYASSSGSSGSSGAGVGKPPPTMVTGNNSSSGSSGSASSDPGSTRPGFGQPKPMPGTTTGGGVQPSSFAGGSSTGTTASPPPVTNTPPVVADAGPGEAAPPRKVEGCDDLMSLEGTALMGRLSPGQTQCLESKLVASDTQTQKDKISRVLLMNAEAAGNKQEWERLMKRHLEEIDRSDPDLCFKYALALSKGGVSRAYGVIKWADYALENKSQWSGTTFKTRVYSLNQLRAEAAVKLWEDSTKKMLAASGEERDKLAAEEEKLRGMAKDYSREWLDYARASGQDVNKPMALCVSAAGSKKFCTEE